VRTKKSTLGIKLSLRRTAKIIKRYCFVAPTLPTDDIFVRIDDEPVDRHA